MAGAGGPCNLPGGFWNLLGALGAPGRRLGSPRDAPGSSKRRPEGQMGPQRLPKELPKSTFFGVGREIREKVKIALPSRRQCNFRGSGTFEIELFWRFWGSRISVEKGTRPRWPKIDSLAPWGRPGRVQGRKWVPPGSPRRPPGSQRGSNIQSKSESFHQCREVGSKTSLQARPGDHFGSIFDEFCNVFEAFWGVYFHICFCNSSIPFKKYPRSKTFPSELSADHLVPMQVPRPLPQGSSRAQFGRLC